jgi:Chlorophyll A-B binding protein
MSLTIDVLVCPSIFTVGMIVQDFVHLPGGPAFSESNPIAAIYAIPVEGWVQILTAVSLVELATFKKTYTSGGDLGFNPLKLKVDDSMRLKELKNGRLGKLISLVGESSFRNVVAHQFLTLSCLLAITSPITSHDCIYWSSLPMRRLQRGPDLSTVPPWICLPDPDNVTYERVWWVDDARGHSSLRVTCARAPYADCLSTSLPARD